MELNIVGAKETESNFSLDKKIDYVNNIKFLDFLSTGINLAKLVASIRNIKHCNVLYLIIDNQFKKKFNVLLRPFLPFIFRFLIKFPHGPSIIVQDTQKTGFLKSISDIYLTSTEKIQDEITKAYKMNNCGHPDWIYKRGIQKERIDWLKNNCEGKILEIGCATGFILNYVGGGVGIDIDKLRLGYAKEKYKDSKFILADATKMPFSDNEFDTVMVPEILEHVEYEYAGKIIKECCRVGKKLLITVPNAGKENYDKGLVENPEHKWFPTRKRMIDLLGEKGTEIGFSKKEDFILIKKDQINQDR